MAETALQRYWRQVRQIAARERVSIREARRVWRDRRVREANGRAARGADLRVAAENLRAASQRQAKAAVRAVVAPVLRLVAKQSESPKVCPYCRDEFGEAVQTQCLLCKTNYHAECGLEVRLCTTLGCRRLLPVPAKPLVTVTPVVVEADRSEPLPDPTHPYLVEDADILEEMTREVAAAQRDKTLDAVFIILMGLFVIGAMFFLWWEFA